MGKIKDNTFELPEEMDNKNNQRLSERLENKRPQGIHWIDAFSSMMLDTLARGLNRIRMHNGLLNLVIA